MTEDNIILIGNKPFMKYVTSVVMMFKKMEMKEVIVKARGILTSKAIDVVEVVMKNFLKDVKVNEVKIDSMEMENKMKKKINVSVIEIRLRKLK